MTGPVAGLAPRGVCAYNDSPMSGGDLSDKGGKGGIDKQLEGRLFDLLETRGRVRLGVLVQLRRRSRAAHITLLQAAIDAGQVDEGVAAEIAAAAGIQAAGLGRRARPADPAIRETAPQEAIPLPPPVPVVVTSSAPPPVVVDPSAFVASAVTATELEALAPDDSVEETGLGDIDEIDAALLEIEALLGDDDLISDDDGDDLGGDPNDDTGAHEALFDDEDDPSTAGTDPPRLGLDTPRSERVDTAPPHVTTIAGVQTDDADLPPLPASGLQYALGQELGRGGMGQVLEAEDVNLGRPVALKLLIEQDDPALSLRFIDEARVQGQLQHPNVPPVYELGRLADGRLFFAMRRIDGRTLRDVIEDLRAEEPEVVRAYGPVRLLMVFGQVCRAIAYAHSRGVIHRDLKPDNIMLGEFGEVTVMDWGLAKVVGSAGGPAVATTRARGEGRFSTLAGEVTGTPQYMPPEQADGRVDELGPHSDIYSLGAVLYELLTLEPPFDGSTARAVREAVVNDRLVPPSERAPQRPIPHVIEQLCLHCLRKRAKDRPPGAAWIAARIDEFLEGEQDRARKEAERTRLVADGAASAAAYYDGYEEHRKLQLKTALMAARIDPWASIEERRELWKQQDAETTARLATARHLSAALAAYHAALGVDGDHAPTRHALRELYYSAFEAAERERDAVLMAHYESLVKVFDDEGTFAARLKGDGRLELETQPRGLSGTLLQYQLVDRVLTPSTPQPLGQMPVRQDPIPMGSYLLRLHAPGLSDAAVPVYISRQEQVRLRLRIFPDALVGQGFAHVVGGPTRLGGDPLAQLAQPARVVEIDDFFIARRPVSAGEYLEFLRDLALEIGVERAMASAPRGSPGGPPVWPIGDDGLPALPERESPDWPVVNVSCDDAEAYCEWLTLRTGRPHRLPDEAEWEKAARGADGRLFPWGDHWEPTFCHMGISRAGPPSRGPCGAFPTDVSPYGVVDLAGGVTEWTRTWLDEGRTQRVVKGGNWASGPTECRAASRFSQPVDQVLPTIGFRVARDAPS